MTPFDKFPIGRQINVEEEERNEATYSYFGMRDRTGRASVTSLLFRAVEGLLSRQDTADRERIAEVLKVIGYKSTINVVFRMDFSESALEELMNSTDTDGPLSANSEIPLRYRKFIRANGSLDREKFGNFKYLAEKSTQFSENGFVSLSFDVSNLHYSEISQFAIMQELRRMGFARLYGVEATLNSGSIIDLKQASSGELSIAISFMALAGSLKDSSLILIDEPETNLHPEWQARYVDLLTSTFKQFYGCHFVLATHSPLIVSDVPNSATICSISDDVPAEGSDVSGKSVDYLLIKAFQTASGSNYFLHDEVVKALRLVADAKYGSVEFRDTVQGLSKIKSIISDNPGIVEVISDLERILAKKSKP
jgi:hypothetical protein